MKIRYKTINIEGRIKNGVDSTYFSHKIKIVKLSLIEYKKMIYYLNIIKTYEYIYHTYKEVLYVFED